ncbi:MAG: hypothetical protein IJH47_08540 [Oscillospiraceae bacterium]|nr:hypothetical protein [Oscillospiraceae bacterium]
MKMKKHSTRWIAALLSLLLLAGCGARDPGGAAVPAPTAAPSSAPAETGVPAASMEPEPVEEPEIERFPFVYVADAFTRSDGVHADVDFADMEWYLYDMTDFTAVADRLAVTDSEEEAQAIYDWLMTEYLRISTLDELAWIDFYAYGTEADQEACQATDELLLTAGDTLYAAVSDALNGSLSREFSAYVGEEMSEALSDYEEMSDREMELKNRETELQLQYNALLSRRDLSEPELAFRAGEILLELVSARNELAQIYGYETFADYAYESYYGRDYTPADAAALCKAIKPYARRYFKNCCYCDAFYVDMGSAAERTPEQLIDLLGYYAPRISPAAAEAQQYMERHGLYLLDSVDRIAELGFTTTLKLYSAPFLYNSLYGNIYDIQSVFHEFGHYYDAYVNQPENQMISMGSYDVFEIHSTGLEALSYGWYDEIFGDRAEEARINCLDGLMYNIISGCIYDEFQQYVYSHPDMTVDELNSVYGDILSSYGRKLWSLSDRYEWMNVSHNFESPFYYVSYAASALASLQIWAKARWDRDEAMELYNDLVSRGAYDQGYCELLRSVGLVSFTDDLDACLKEAYAALEEMCLRYDSRS